MSRPTPLCLDNQGSIFLGVNPVVERRTKHIDIRHHYIREQVELGKVEVFFVATQDQLADCKGTALFALCPYFEGSCIAVLRSADPQRAQLALVFGTCAWEGKSSLTLTIPTSTPEQYSPAQRTWDRGYQLKLGRITRHHNFIRQGSIATCNELRQQQPSSTAFKVSPTGKSTFDLIPSGQVGLDEADLPGQLVIGTGVNATKSGPKADINTLNGTVFNGGNATSGEGWAATLQRELANRYVASVLCSWHATGGEIPNLLPRLSDKELNVTQSVNNTGNMFEKFSMSDIDSAGRGGEYTVQAGFGWTNGVLLWVASNYGNVLVPPKCPDLLEQTQTTSTSKTNAAPMSAAVSISAMLLSVVVVALSNF
ncbi:hypothetical protein NUW54_g3138 [Trametes sanguinea]|uniref:Uncharacterized protein n=1 Tax=Trametes sanguinea TaxID=158606 RepID=A0ACC1Q386_9APHY|nr:hypothetical protein NUW54_g3138 [Trametes sanguinea]